MKFKVGDKVRVIGYYKYNGCEGVVIEADEESWSGCYQLEFYKLNDNVTEEDIEKFYIYFTDKELELIPRLNVKNLRKEKVTKIISTEDSLEDIIPFFEE